MANREREKPTHKIRTVKMFLQKIKCLNAVIISFSLFVLMFFMKEIQKKVIFLIKTSV